MNQIIAQSWRVAIRSSRRGGADLFEPLHVDRFADVHPVELLVELDVGVDEPLDEALQPLFAARDDHVRTPDDQLGRHPPRLAGRLALWAGGVLQPCRGQRSALRVKVGGRPTATCARRRVLVKRIMKASHWPHTYWRIRSTTCYQSWLQ